MCIIHRNRAHSSIYIAVLGKHFNKQLTVSACKSQLTKKMIHGMQRLAKKNIMFIEHM